MNVNVDRMVAEAAEVLQHEIAAKLGVKIDLARAIDLARNVVQAQLGAMDEDA